MTMIYRNYTLKECDAALSKHLAAIRSGRMTFFQKFTCDQCFARITMDEPNKLFVLGRCDECGHFTDLVKNGCNYLAVFK